MSSAPSPPSVDLPLATASNRQAIVLAGGAGRRFGGDKLLADWRGEPLIRAAVRTALAATVGAVTVVTGSDADRVAQALEPLAGPRLRRVPAADWKDGMAASLRAGIAALPPETRAVVIFLGDMPLIPITLADRLLDAVMAGGPAASVRSPHGLAHPVAFGSGAFEQLRSLTGDRGARAILEALGDAVAVIDCDDPGVVFDVDHPDDLRHDPRSASAQRA